MTHHIDRKKFKNWHVILLCIIALCALGYHLYLRHWPTGSVYIGNQKFRVLVAKTPVHRYEGWGNKKNMQGYDGMIFLYDTSGEHAMVMRNMLFPIDIVWVDKGRVVDMAPHVRPEPGKPEANLTPYFSRLPSIQVLEFFDGFIDTNKLKIGDEVRLAQ